MVAIEGMKWSTKRDATKRTGWGVEKRDVRNGMNPSQLQNSTGYYLRAWYGGLGIFGQLWGFAGNANLGRYRLQKITKWLQLQVDITRLSSTLFFFWIRNDIWIKMASNKSSSSFARTSVFCAVFSSLGAFLLGFDTGMSYLDHWS